MTKYVQKQPNIVTFNALVEFEYQLFLERIYQELCSQLELGKWELVFAFLPGELGRFPNLLTRLEVDITNYFKTYEFVIDYESTEHRITIEVEVETFK